MHQFITRFFSFCVCMIFAAVLMAQKPQNYEILVHSGKFVPEQNAKTVTGNSKIFTDSRFLNKHYLVIQFASLPTNVEKQAFKNAGIQLIDYIPNNAFTASVNAGIDLAVLKTSHARSIFNFTTAQKTVASLLQGNFPAHAVKSNGTIDLIITSYEKLSSADVASSFNALGVTILQELPMFKNFVIRIPQQNFTKLVGLAFVQWVEAIDPPNKAENLLGRSLHRVNNLNDGVRNLKGDGINIGIWDGGEVEKHIDFSPVNSRIILQETAGVTDHGTHCSGTIGGGGLIDPKARGMAPKSKIYSFDFFGNIPAEQALAIPGQGLSVSSHSYGSTQTCGITGSGVSYSTNSRNTDLNLNAFPNHLHVHSAGNSQPACAGGWSTITSSGKSSKNNILVANITSDEFISNSSSFGPVADGRVKPEISSFGTGVLSTVLNNGYASFTGTSMSTPGVAGSVALLVQRYRQLNANAEPVSALIKNTILNTAGDLGNPGPDYRFGYGRINALAAVRILEQNRYAVNTISTGLTNDLSLNVPAGAAHLRVMITWNDPAGTANVNPALVNNLDLSLINGAVTSLPWILDGNNPSVSATTGVDNVSNIEQVSIVNPAAGNYTLRVQGTAIPMGPQQYTITWSIDQPYIEIIYPNGSESLSPGIAETITWDNAGITANQTIEYSLDNGLTWTNIATVGAATTRLDWTAPSGANTAVARIRVSSGAISDISDAGFKIIGTPAFLTTTPSCLSGELAFSWPAVINATHYELLKLDEATGQFVTVANNLTGTSYTATGLTAGVSTWFSLMAKNNITGAVSERVLAINRVVPASGFNTIGAITGNETICGPTVNVIYSVPAVVNANTYTWTVPAGAVLVGGQGTNNIIVNYPTGSISGNVTVFATGGSCLTPIVSFPVTVSSTVTAAPVSGGNQSQTHCSAGPIPTLTATATVPPNHSVIWYSAASGGTVVASPILNSYGTITYYALSRNNSGNCESAARTAVTLTLNASVAPTVSAAGPLVFCQGGSVILTASAGNAYTWSNGATSSSITVTASGSYTVTIDQGNGCLNISSATVVTVNPLPAINITAGTSPTFCQGGNVTLTATTGNIYLWSNGATTQSITVNNAGSYSVTVNQGNACINTSAATVVTVNSLPVAAVNAGGSTSFCQGSSVVLTASAGSAWLWNTGATTQSITANTTGNYSVTVTNASGCTAISGSTPVTVSPVPPVSLMAAPYTKLFPGISTTLTATAGSAVSYAWYKNGTLLPAVTGSTLPVTIDNLGSYSVTVTNAGGCSNTSSLVSITDSASAKLFIYPNPSKGQFQLSYYSATLSRYMLTVYDSKGAKIINKSFDNVTGYQRMPVDIRNHGKGTYRIVLSDRNGKKIANGAVMVL